MADTAGYFTPFHNGKTGACNRCNSCHLICTQLQNGICSLIKVVGLLTFVENFTFHCGVEDAGESSIEFHHNCIPVYT